MESRDSKRKKDKDSENREYKNNDKKPKKRRSRSRTPKENRHGRTKQKRKYSKSPSPSDAKYGKRKNDKSSESQNQPEAPIRKIKETDMLNTKTGGAYIPPARLRMMQAQITDKSSVAYQRLAWEALKKSIHGHINKINVGNIGIIIKELLKENIVRGRGLLCRSVIQAQAASPTFTNVYAALAGAINSRFPNIGELLLKRLVIQFKRGFKRNDKPICISSASFIAHLVNQKVAHEILALELLTLLVETPTDDSVEVAIAFLKECGQKLTEVSSKGINAIFEMLRNILHEGQLDKRVQYMIEVMFQVWKDGFKDHPAVIEELELVPEEEQFTHLLMLDDATDSQDILNVFKFDDKYEENEQKYKTLCKEILGSDAESGEEDGSEGSGSEESDDNEDEEGENKEMTIIDKTETNLVALRRTIYLTINSSLDFEECAHKLMKMQLKPGQEIELCHMFLDCCAEQRTYEKFYGLLAQRFCNINRIYIGPFEEIFKDSYATAHRLDTNRLRNVSKFFAHLLFTDSISWEVLECFKLNEEDTTSSSRIYIKILFQELAEYMGLKKLNERLKDPTLQQAFSGVFPRDNPRNTRFSINFFTSIGLGGLTDELREHLKQMPKNVPSPITEININSESSSTSSSSSSDDSSTSDSSSSDSEDEKQKNGKKINNKKKKSKKQKTPDPEEPTQKDITSERWGHDGFYDTYGLGARRAVPNSSEGERSNVRKSAREIERDKRNYDYINGDERGKRDRRTERRESRDDIEAFKKYRENPSRRKGNEDGDERRRNGNGEKRTRRDNENENKVIRDVDEKSHRRDKENESRPRRINEDDRKYRRYNEDERGQRRDYSDERRQKRDNANERTQKRQSDDEIKQRRDCEDESKRKRNSEGVKKQRNDSNDKVSRTRENEYDNRHKNDNEDVRRRRKEKENVSNHKSDKEKGTGRKRDGGDQERNEKNLKSKDKIYIDRNNGRSNKKESRNKKDEEKKCGIKDKEKSVRNKPKNRKKRDSERRAKEKVKKRAETESDTDSDSGTDSSSDSSSSSSNDSSSDSDLDDSKHFKKPKEYKKKENLGGRYWDTFDIDSGRGTEEEREKIN